MPCRVADEERNLSRPCEGSGDLSTVRCDVGGAYHEVRRIFAALGSHVLALCRTAFGRLALPRDLALGSHVSVDLTAI